MRGRTFFHASAALLPALLAGACGGPRAPRAPASLDSEVLAVIATYPTDGTHRYYWPKTGDWIGNARDLPYDGRLFAKGDPEGRCHCSGLTFEVFLEAWERSCRARGLPERILDWDASRLRRFQEAWFGTDGDRRTLARALVQAGLGDAVRRRKDARPGDFVQLWRHSGSGHSCVFLAWVREGGKITGIRYWSTQSSTNGIGVHEESFGATGSSVDASDLYVVRARAPSPSRR